MNTIIQSVLSIFVAIASFSAYNPHGSPYNSTSQLSTTTYSDSFNFAKNNAFSVNFSDDGERVTLTNRAGEVFATGEFLGQGAQAKTYTITFSNSEFPPVVLKALKPSSKKTPADILADFEGQKRLLRSLAIDFDHFDDDLGTKFFLTKKYDADLFHINFHTNFGSNLSEDEFRNTSRQLADSLNPIFDRLRVLDGDKFPETVADLHPGNLFWERNPDGSIRIVVGDGAIKGKDTLNVGKSAFLDWYTGEPQQWKPKPIPLDEFHREFLSVTGVPWDDAKNADLTLYQYANSRSGFAVKLSPDKKFVNFIPTTFCQDLGRAG